MRKGRIGNGGYLLLFYGEREREIKLTREERNYASVSEREQKMFPVMLVLGSSRT